MDSDEDEDEDLSFVRYTDEYLNAIAAHCPNLECFDGTRVTNGNMDRVYSEQMLFYRARNSATSIGSAHLWTTAWHSKKYLDAEGFKFSARSLGAMLSACPALTRMHIQISTVSRRLKEVKNGFNDDFLVALSQHCKRLNYLSVSELPDVMDTQPITHPSRVGDRGFAALASLPHLCTVTDLDAPQASPRGVFDLLVKPLHARDRRVFSLTFGEPRSRDGDAFFGLLSVLLEKLARLPADTLHSDCNFDVTLTLDYKFKMKKHDVVKARLKVCVQQFTFRFPECALSFSICETDSWGLHWKYDKSNVPDDLTEIYCVSIATGGAGVGNRESSNREVRIRPSPRIRYPL